MQTKKRNLLLIIKIKSQKKLKVDTYILTIKIKSTITKNLIILFLLIFCFLNHVITKKCFNTSK